MEHVIMDKLGQKSTDRGSDLRNVLRHGDRLLQLHLREN